MELPPEVQALAAAAERYVIPSGDGQLTWHAWGKGPPLVLLHGGSGSWTHWVRNLPALLESGRRVLAADLPGFGASDRLAGVTDADECVEPLVHGIRQLAGGQQVDLVGFSFGGVAASFIAAAHPGLLRRLVVAGVPILPLNSGRGVPLTRWRASAPRQERLLAHRANLAALMLHREEAIDDLALAIQDANVTRDRMPGRKVVTTERVSQTLLQVQVPTWAIYGAQDVLFRGRWDEVRERWGRVPGLRRLTLIPDAGHWVQYEQPAAFDQVLREALACRLT